MIMGRTRLTTRGQRERKRFLKKQAQEIRDLSARLMSVEGKIKK